MQHVFETPEPPVLSVEIGSGHVLVHASDVEQTVIDVTGRDADDVVVEQRGHQIVVIAPKRTGFFSVGRDLRVEATVPTDSELVTRLGSADVTTDGALGWVKLASGSGDVTLEDVNAEALVKSGSGDITIGSIGGPANLTSGSGDIEVDRLGDAAQLSTGSGDIRVTHAGAALSVKSGSGDLEVRDAGADAVLSTASGNVRIGRFPAGKLTTRSVSGDVSVGIPAGVPVWTDITSASGTVRSRLTGAGEPAEGQPYVELRARTVSGDVLLDEVGV
jgi:DUF4097 and DUF4098 domain-containing protein YvlB